MNLTITDEELAGLPQELLDQLKLKEKSKKPKPAPVLLTDEEKREILKGAFGIDPAFDGHLMRMSTDIESAVLRKNGWGV